MLISHFPNHLVYDTQNEYQDFNTYVPQNRSGDGISRTELSNVIHQFILGQQKLEVFIIDEANRYLHPKPTPLPSGALMLNDDSRHEQTGFWCIARRPVQLHSDIMELAHKLVIFTLRGKNDEQYLNSICKGLGDAVTKLPFFHFIIVDEQRNWQVYKPI